MDISDLSKRNLHLDSHADTCAAGSNFVPLENLKTVTHHVSVSPFSDDYEPIHDVPLFVLVGPLGQIPKRASLMFSS